MTLDAWETVPPGNESALMQVINVSHYAHPVYPNGHFPAAVTHRVATARCRIAKWSCGAHTGFGEAPCSCRHVRGAIHQELARVCLCLFNLCLSCCCHCNAEELLLRMCYAIMSVRLHHTCCHHRQQHVFVMQLQGRHL